MREIILNKFIFVVLIMILISSCESDDKDKGNKPTATGSAQGIVTNFDTGALVNGASITLNGFVATTNAEGIYLISNIPAGQKTITISKVGFKNHAAQIEITADITTTLDVSLVEFSESVIDFELVAGNIPVEGLEIAQQFSDTHGVTFSLDNGSSPVVSMVGGVTASAFGSIYGNDTAAPGESIGKYFLTDDGLLSGLSSPALIAIYDPPAIGAAGIILDLDFDESFNVSAFDIDGNSIKEITINAGDQDTGDGIGTDWIIESDTRNISKIVFTGSRKASGAFGFGFDNFLARTK